MEGSLGPVVEMDLTGGPTRRNFFVVCPAYNWPSLSLSVLEVHHHLSSEDIPYFEIGSVNGYHV